MGIHRVHHLSKGLFLLGMLFVGAGCHRAQTSAGLELQSEPYSAARTHFQTHLLRQGPAPQQGEMLHPPTGAEHESLRFFQTH